MGKKKIKRTTGQPQQLDSFSSRFLDWVTIGVVATCLLYFAASYFPGWGLWGFDQLAFYPLWARILWILLPLALLFSRLSVRIFTQWEKGWKAIRRNPALWATISGAVAMILFWLLRFRTDMYGDSRTILKQFGEETVSWKMFFTGLRPDQFEAMERFLHSLTVQILGIDLSTCYIAGSIIAGGIFVFAVIRYISREQLSSEMALLMGGLLILNGGSALFLGHIENYTWIYLFILLFFLSSWDSLDGKGGIWRPTLYFAIATLLHTQVVVLLPALGFVYAVALSRRIPKIKAFFTTRKVVFYLFLPTLVIGTLCYFFVFQSGVEQYELGLTKETIFLPIISHSPGYHYTIFHPYHFIDLISEIFLVTSAGALLVIVLSILFHRKGCWSEHRVLFSLIGVFYYGLFAFTVRPALALPRDWDLMANIGLPMVFLAVSLFRQIPLNTNVAKQVIPGIVALSLLSASVFGVHASTSMSSRRLEEVGYWTYHTYYYGSHYIISAGERMIGNVNDEIRARQAMIKRIESHTFQGDEELMSLYVILGDVQTNVGYVKEAWDSYWTAYKIGPGYKDILEKVAISLYNLREYEKTRELVDQLANASPDDPEVLQLQGLLALMVDHDTTATVRFWKRLEELHPNHPVTEWTKNALNNLYPQNR